VAGSVAPAWVGATDLSLSPPAGPAG